MWLQHPQTPPGGAPGPSADEAGSRAPVSSIHSPNQICSQPSSAAQEEALASGSWASSGPADEGAVQSMGLGPHPGPPQPVLPLGRAS